ncbi:MAG TPA: hypothetical protein VHF88_01425 [Thermoleophilaceae bacterium]|nr:hypothetical protein [Thermoleophilaceae bacterium]
MGMQGAQAELRGRWRRWLASPVPLTLLAAAVLPASASAAPDFKVALPSAGDMTVAVVNFKVDPPKDKRKLGKLVGDLTLETTAKKKKKLDAAVLSSLVGRRVGDKLKVTGLVTLVRPEDAKEASSEKLKKLGFELTDGMPSSAEKLAKLLAQERKRKEQLAKQLQVLKLEHQKLAKQLVQPGATGFEDVNLRLLEVLQLIREVTETRREVERRVRELDTELRKQQLLEAAKQLKRSEGGLGDPKVVGDVKKSESKNALENPKKTGEVLAKTKLAGKLIKKLDDEHSKQRVDEKELGKAIIQAFLDKKDTEKQDQALEKLKRSLESQKCKKGALILLCEDQKPPTLETPNAPPSAPPKLTPTPGPNDPLPPPDEPAPGPELAISLSHSDEGWFNFCIDIATTPPQPGASGTYSFGESGTEGFGPEPFVLDENGRAKVVFEGPDPAVVDSFFAEVTLDWPGIGPITERIEGPGWGSLVGTDECSIDLEG